jgi:hypothetical protein
MKAGVVLGIIAARNKVHLPVNVSAIIQGRAWSSWIWHTPTAAITAKYVRKPVLGLPAMYVS